MLFGLGLLIGFISLFVIEVVFNKKVNDRGAKVLCFIIIITTLVNLVFWLLT